MLIETWTSAGAQGHTLPCECTARAWHLGTSQRGHMFSQGKEGLALTGMAVSHDSRGRHLYRAWRCGPGTAPVTAWPQFYIRRHWFRPELKDPYKWCLQISSGAFKIKMLATIKDNRIRNLERAESETQKPGLRASEELHRQPEQKWRTHWLFSGLLISFCRCFLQNLFLKHPH